MKNFYKFFVIVLALCLCSCGGEVAEKAEKLKPVMKKEITAMGYDIVKNPLPVVFGIDNSSSAFMLPWIVSSTLEEYETEHFYGMKLTSKEYNEFLIVKGKRKNSTYYYKDCGEHTEEKPDGRTETMHWTRDFVLTEIEITEIFEQKCRDNKPDYKVGDKLVVVEFEAYARNKQEKEIMRRGGAFDSPPMVAISDEETLFYLRLPENFLEIGKGDPFESDYLENVYKAQPFFTKEDVELLIDKDSRLLKKEVFKELKKKYF